MDLDLSRSDLAEARSKCGYV